jgi:hypothetical protein
VGSLGGSIPKGSAVSENLSDPISLVAAEIHHGTWPAGISGGWPGFPNSKLMPARHKLKNDVISIE